MENSTVKILILKRDLFYLDGRFCNKQNFEITISESNLRKDIPYSLEVYAEDEYPYGTVSAEITLEDLVELRDNLDEFIKKSSSSGMGISSKSV